ncbi:MmgE/PrpD family protein [Parasphingorhabdus pacifica]
MSTLADRIAQWAVELAPSEQDLALAERSLLDTVAVALAARRDPVGELAASLPEPARWAAVGHVLDFDDLHVDSTTHISVVCVPATLATGGDARAYLAGAGVMARIGNALGWEHYTQGWHTTCTAGAPAAAVAAAVSLGLDADGITRAIALAVPAAGGVQQAFGTATKSLQVGFAAEAGVRAARLAAAGATAAPGSLEQWLELVGGAADRVDLSGPAVPGGLAIKVFPCCYALQRPISAVRDLGSKKPAAHEVAAIMARTPAGTVHPLIHHRPSTGLQGKFSLEYAIATAVLDEYPDFDSFTDSAVQRAEAQRLLKVVSLDATPDEGDGLLAGDLTLEFALTDGTTRTVGLQLPPGAPQRPPTDRELRDKLAACGADVPGLLRELTWSEAAHVLRREFPGND